MAETKTPCPRCGDENEKLATHCAKCFCDVCSLALTPDWMRVDKVAEVYRSG